MRRITAFASAAAVALAGFAAVPLASAADATTTASISLTCKATPSTPLAGPQTFSADDVSVNVTSPESVEVGEEFSPTFTIDPVSIAVPSLPLGARLEKASRLKLDFALPAGVSYVGAEVDESSSNLPGFTVLQVNEDGAPDRNGRILRLTSRDNATIGNGTNTSRNIHDGVSYDITGSTIDLRFPVVTLKLRADEAGDKHLGVRTAGNAGNFGADENFLTLLGSTSYVFPVGNVFAPTQCSPRPSAEAPIDERANRLATIRVNPEPAAVETSVSLGGATGAVAGRPATLTATVTPEAEGTVTFASGSLETTADVVDGTATGELTFPEAGSYEVTASFTPSDARRFTASSTTGTVDVEGQETAMTIDAAVTAPARNRVDVTATLDEAARGTVSFRIGEGAEVTADVDGGTAKASVPTGTAVGKQTITATYRPATGSPFGPAEATAEIEITAVTDTALELGGLDLPVRPGEATTITAAVTPAENTDSAEGAVVFGIDGQEFRADVADNAASVEFTPDRGGDFPVTARFIPADDTQTEARATGTLKVTEAAGTTVTAEAPTNVQPLVEAPTKVTVSPAADGTVSATIDGRTITADVTDGQATLPLVFPREGDFEVPIRFTPADPATAKRAETTITVTVGEPAYESVSIDIEGPADGKVGEKLDYRATVTPDVGDRTGVTGFLTMTNNGRPIQRDGEDVRVPVVRGIAEFDLTWPSAGAQKIEATFHGTDGKELGSGSKTVTITGSGATEPTEPTETTEPTEPTGTTEPTAPTGSSSASSTTSASSTSSASTSTSSSPTSEPTSPSSTAEPTAPSSSRPTSTSSSATTAPSSSTTPADPSDPDVGGSLPHDSSRPGEGGSSSASSFFEMLWRWLMGLLSGGGSLSSLNLFPTR